jgi:hypothetical protein
VASQLETAEFRNATPEEILDIWRVIPEPDELWEVADRTVPYVAIFEGLRARAIELGASLDTANGYLALAYLFAGPPADVKAKELVKQTQPESTDPVLLEAWALTADNQEERVARLRLAISRAADPTRLWRQLRNTGQLLRSDELMAEADQWLQNR